MTDVLGNIKWALFCGSFPAICGDQHWNLIRGTYLSPYWHSRLDFQLLVAWLFSVKMAGGLHQLRFRYHRISPYLRGVLLFEGLKWEDAWQQCVQCPRGVMSLNVPFSKRVSAWHSDMCHAGFIWYECQIRTDAITQTTGICCNWQHNCNNLTLFCSGLMDLLFTVFEIMKKGILSRVSQKGRIFSLITGTA